MDFNIRAIMVNVGLLMILLESKAVKSCATVIMFITIHLTYRSICLIFFLTGLAAIIIPTFSCLFGLIMLFFSAISLRGYIHFKEKYIMHTICSYVSINTDFLKPVSQKEEQDAIQRS